MRKHLTGKQKRYLRSLGTALKPVVMVGQQGVTPAVVQAIEMAFNGSELIKVKLQQGVTEDRHRVAERLAAASRSHLIQVLGRTILLYRPDPDKPEIVLPGENQ